jgi:phage tail sheath gpL-like
MVKVQIPLYRDAGHPATATVTLAAMPVNGNTVTIAGVVYTFGVDFTGIDQYEIAKSLVAVINADPDCERNPVPNTQPIKNCYALFYGRVVRLIATFPGTAGNSLALSTNNSAAFVVSGATFTGGAAAGAIP